jgi:branched-chain amino acid transport system substrate-binding protein
MADFTDGQSSAGDGEEARRSRRRFLLGAAALGIGGPLLAACSDDGEGADDSGETAADGAGTTAGEATGTTVADDGGAAGGDLPEVTIGYVTPRTGPLAAFGEADDFVLATIGAALGANVTIIDRDSESDPAKAGDVTNELIAEGANLVLVSSTPDTTIPVASACDLAGVPCISTMAPWQPHYLNTGGALGPEAPDPPEAATEWNYHFFWGLEDIISNFVELWDTLGVEKVVGGLWPNDPDGLAWSDANVGFPPALEAAGYTVVDPGRFELDIQDFTAIINQFKDEGVTIVSGVVPPPVFANFQSQAIQQGLEVPVITIAKAALFPSAAESFPSGAGITTEVWWTANHPFTSSLTGQSAAELAEAFEAEGSQWTQPLGFAHALFEVAADVLSRAGSSDPEAIREAMAATSMDTVIGPVDFSTGPVPNYSKTPMVMGQWVDGETYPFELAVVQNTGLPEVPVDAEPQLMS